MDCFILHVGPQIMLPPRYITRHCFKIWHIDFFLIRDSLAGTDQQRLRWYSDWCLVLWSHSLRSHGWLLAFWWRKPDGFIQKSTYSKRIIIIIFYDIWLTNRKGVPKIRFAKRNSHALRGFQLLRRNSSSVFLIRTLLQWVSIFFFTWSLSHNY